ncbi:FxSxx-COOH system tetratricopeptide repeat protein [Streptomyces pseudovenezuelae]|uniref:Tetratricopeptide (TPR) repeat protein n=1 Tax=Streptomyces pseudovenezuelae TaxID=67350 RepID=A0ABT6LEW4_9ACTN|nr:FxSxx-COOH system tetratricopeptide repeat protein [Streptomyces pseudovenezuelae]MDH6214843.1 tetratricopeptide (TPR) repeat protein [Streptomyces pseudovenezuelae]
MHDDDGQRPAQAARARREAAHVLSRLGQPDDSEPAEAVLVVDSYPSMRVWTEVVEDLAEELRRAGDFVRVRVVPLRGTDETDPARVTKRNPLSAVPLNARQVVLVLTDGLAAGWRLRTLEPLLREWGASCPVALVHLLPQHLWYRTGLDVSRVRIHAPHAWAPNKDWTWLERDARAVSEESDESGGSEGAPVLVPVLAFNDRWAKALLRLIAGPQPEWLDLCAVQAREWKRRPDAARALPWAEGTPDPHSTMPATARVSDFRAAASPTAFTLATRLAAAPLSLPAIRSVVATTPDAGPVHVSELLMSGLVRLTRTDGEGAADLIYTFASGIREELLALGRRSDTARILREIRALFAGDPATSDLLPSPAAPLDSEERPGVTHRNVAFLRVELTALHALSGRYKQRAALLEEALSEHDRRRAANLDESPQKRTPSTPSVTPPTEIGRGTAPSPSTTSEGASRMPTTPQGVEGQRQAQPRIWGNLPPRNFNFTGRADLLELLDQRLREGTTAVLPEALHGMGGVGKTQLAIEYAYRHQNEYDIVWWIPSERPGQIAQALVELAQRLGLGTSTEANIAIPAVREALREGRPYDRWLLIFDNADSPEQVRHYFPPGGDGTILVTSRNRRWGQVGRALEVDVFSREESKELLRRSGPPLEDGEADALAEALGDLPLALEQAAAWRAETGMSASEYLRLFESKRVELLEVAPPPDYQLPVAAAWNVSLDHLETRSPAALQLLQMCSYFAPDPISRSIFSGLGNSQISPELDAALNDPMRLSRAIREVNRYSLARIDHRTNSLEMHRLVQLVLQTRMSPEERSRMRQGAHTLMVAYDPKDPADPTSWPRYAELYSHVIASEAIKSDQAWVRQLVRNIAEYLYYWGDHELSLEFSKQAWEVWRDIFGEEDQQALLMGQWLGFVNWAVGRFDEAARLAEHLKGVYERTAPAAGDDTREDALDALQFEAAVRRAEGRFAEAAELDQFAYERARRAFGEDDPTTLNIAHNVGVSLRLTGEFREALELDRRTLDLKRRLFSDGDRRILITEYNLAVDVRETGDYVGARELHESVQEAYREAFGLDNPSTIEAVRQLSESCRKEGDHVRSLELATDAHTQLGRRYPEAHPRSLAAALTLSVALRQNGDLEAARTRGVNARDRYRKVYDARHPHVLSADVDLAVTLRLLGRAEEAHRLDEAALVSLTERLGEGHPLALVCAVNLASDLAALGRHEDARLGGEATLELCRITFGEDHPTTLACAGNLALDLIATDAGEQGHMLREDTLARMERVLDEPRLQRASGTPHPATVQFRAGERANCDIDPLPL